LLDEFDEWWRGKFNTRTAALLAVMQKASEKKEVET